MKQEAARVRTSVLPFEREPWSQALLQYSSRVVDTPIAPPLRGVDDRFGDRLLSSFDGAEYTVSAPRFDKNQMAVPESA